MVSRKWRLELEPAFWGKKIHVKKFCKGGMNVPEQWVVQLDYTVVSLWEKKRRQENRKENGPSFWSWKTWIMKLTGRERTLTFVMGRHSPSSTLWTSDMEKHKSSFRNLCPFVKFSGSWHYLFTEINEDIVCALLEGSPFFVCAYIEWEGGRVELVNETRLGLPPQNMEFVCVMTWKLIN